MSSAPLIKSAEQARCFIVIDAGYFLIRELVHALQELGHRPLVVRLPLHADTGRPDTSQYGSFLREIAVAATQNRASALITVNHLGFDCEGILTRLLERIKLPALIWYVDSPRYIFQNSAQNVSPWVGIFVWDQAYIPWLQQLGFDKVQYLPLATDAKIFSAPKIHAADKRHIPQNALVFVGDSMAATVHKALKKLPPELLEGYSDGGEGALARLADSFCRIAFSDSSTQRQAPWEIMRGMPQAEGSLMSESFGSARNEIGDKLNLESALALIATRRRRVAFIESALRTRRIEMTIICGDSGWDDALKPLREVLNGALQITPAADYYQELPGIYHAAGAILNLSSLQMPTGLNQRCYDVPAAGGFLLTDHQAALSEQFEPGREIVAFRSLPEMLDKLDYFRRQPQRRREVIARGQRRALQEHLYRHRLSKLLESAKSWFS